MEAMLSNKAITDKEIGFNSVTSQQQKPPTSLSSNGYYDDQFIGSLFAEKYLIEKKLGNGGMGVVYLANHTFMDRQVAIKFLRNINSTSDTAIEHFKQEARAAGRIQHPNATTVLDFGAINDIFYLVMEYLKGETLRDRLYKKGKFSLSEALPIITKVCEVVTAAHKCNVVHCDLKPDNIFLHVADDSEIVKVLDFGIAKIMKEGPSSTIGIRTNNAEIVGTPYYMSPEQCQGDRLGPATDIYSLGIICFEMLTGQLPFDGKSAFSIALKHLGTEPPKLREFNPEIPQAIEDVIMQALKKNPKSRQQSALLFAEELEKAWQSSDKSVVCIVNTPAYTVNNLANIKTLANCSNPSCTKPELGLADRCHNCNTLLAHKMLNQRYEVQQLVGKSVFGTSYLVIDHGCSGEKRILKELKNLVENENTEEDNAEVRQLFQHNAETLLKLQHPAIPKLHAYFDEENYLYLVQDFVLGQNLLEELKNRTTPFNEQEAINVLSEMADILEYLHLHNPPIIHHDIKPQNLIRNLKGQLMLTDFCATCQLATTTIHQTFIGSPGFAPPEQILGNPTEQSDIYGCAATIVYLLTGISPGRLFNRKTMKLDWGLRVNVSNTFKKILESMLVPDISERMQNVEELKKQIKELTKQSNQPNQLLTSSHRQLQTQSLPLLNLTLPIGKAEISSNASSQNLQSNQRTPNKVNESIDIQSTSNFCYEVEEKLRSIESSNYYTVLGLERTASVIEIQVAYQRIVDRFDPNKYTQITKHYSFLQTQLEKILSKAKDAHRLLTDPSKRKEYNSTLNASLKSKIYKAS